MITLTLFILMILTCATGWGFAIFMPAGHKYFPLVPHSLFGVTILLCMAASAAAQLKI